MYEHYLVTKTYQIDKHFYCQRYLGIMYLYYYGCGMAMKLSALLKEKPVEQSIRRGVCQTYMQEPREILELESRSKELVPPKSTGLKHSTVPTGQGNR